ncbi:Prefoldin, subunit 3 [Thamnocephalis sphaerospora]|uniref:Prefoldin subunit 3 n=1 Tax=Thamnocephalis sphaerospora TaxID=78915 RepID=A0A4P9XU38_9FUNG|nr:Prefoldin, subunit 3 [Thamnocephalis sphaerospora]|eukprot:RKP09091.1 Prefoldin, subunit 3 [Thamnocephalis sphaerospora]
MTTAEKNPRGIPKALFVEDVSAFLSGYKDSTELGLRHLQEVLSKYRFMEANMLQRKQSMLSKIPEIEKTLQMAKYLEERKASSEEPISVQYELHDTLYATARVQPRETVYLWLGANVMLEYPIAEAIALLTDKLEVSRRRLTHAEEDLEFLRDQITVTEVNTARVFNWDVKMRRQTAETSVTVAS